MNTIGKILVVLTFVCSLIMVAFVAMTFTTRNNWADQETKYRRELEVAYANNRALSQSLSEKTSQLQEAKTEVDSTKSTIAVKEAEIATLKVEKNEAVKASDDRAKFADLIAQKAVDAQGRMQQEVVQLKTIIGDREDRIVKVQAKLKDTTDLAMTLDRDLKFSQERNVLLVARVQELERAVARAGSSRDRVEEPAGQVRRDPNASQSAEPLRQGSRRTRRCGRQEPHQDLARHRPRHPGRQHARGLPSESAAVRRRHADRGRAVSHGGGPDGPRAGREDAGGSRRRHRGERPRQLALEKRQLGNEPEASTDGRLRPNSAIAD